MFKGLVSVNSFKESLEVETRESNYPHGISETHVIIKEDLRIINCEVNYFNQFSEFIEDFWLNEIICQEIEYLETFCYNSKIFDLGKDLNENLLSLEKIIQEIEEEFEDEFETLKKLTEIGWRLNALNKVELKGLIIEEIVAEVSGTGLGSDLIRYYKKHLDYIFLYSLSDSVSYWENQEFKEFFNGYYFWTKDSDLESIVLNF